ncbi:hypothetical protein AB2B41_02540 [Marimonas sp. MJW-29]|uniref:Uncharacterized protein n=1 Tax=Sulfitobacter sediminis TaxID=3234186 RepID=A0ABV3RIL5_9RHOB
MTQPDKTNFIRAVGHLAIALLNATLILLVLALYFGWRLMGAVDSATETAVTAASAQVERLTSVQNELQTVRRQLEDLKNAEDLRITAAVEPTSKRLSDIGARLAVLRSGIGNSVDAVAADPGIIFDRAMKAGMAEFGYWLTTVTNCDAPRLAN